MIRVCLWYMLENVWRYVAAFTMNVHTVLMRKVVQAVIRERCKEFVGKRLEKERGERVKVGKV